MIFLLKMDLVLFRRKLFSKRTYDPTPRPSASLDESFGLGGPLAACSDGLRPSSLRGPRGDAFRANSQFSIDPLVA